MRRRGTEVLCIGLYLAAAIAANFSVMFFGPISTPFNAFVLVALDLVTRDMLHERWHRHLWRNMFLLILAGSVITYLLNAGAVRIAVASTVAFLATGVADTVMYHLLRRFPRLKRVVGSNVVSARSEERYLVGDARSMGSQGAGQLPVGTAFYQDHLAGDACQSRSLNRT
mgnify:CR=1 FL=1